jgi:hypothetical protein
MTQCETGKWLCRRHSPYAGYDKEPQYNTYLKQKGIELAYLFLGVSQLVNKLSDNPNDPLILSKLTELTKLKTFMTVGLPIITEETLTELKEKAHIVVQEKGAEHGLDATLVLPNVIYLNYRRVEQMCNDMLRVQEFAENPKFYRTTMSWSRLKHHYGSRAKKMFAGFNIPSWAFIDSYEHDWNHLTEAEKNIRKFLDDCLTNYALNIPYYVIASADASAKKPSQEAMKHELAHALAYTNDLYFSKVQEILSKYDLSQIKKKLLTWNIYHPSVIDDEAHAYLATETPSSIYGTFHVPCKGDILKAHEEFKALLDETLSTTLLGRGHD